MELFTASDARRRFGRLLETAQREPVMITKAVLLGLAEQVRLI